MFRIIDLYPLQALFEKAQGEVFQLCGSIQTKGVGMTEHSHPTGFIDKMNGFSRCKSEFINIGGSPLLQIPVESLLKISNISFFNKDLGEMGSSHLPSPGSSDHLFIGNVNPQPIELLHHPGVSLFSCSLEILQPLA